jgi:lysozyme
VVEDDVVNRRPPAKGWLSGLGMWLPYAAISGLGAYGVLQGVSETIANGTRDVTSESQMYAGPVLALLSCLLLIMGLYYLFRALTRDE